MGLGVAGTAAAVGTAVSAGTAIAGAAGAGGAVSGGQSQANAAQQAQLAQNQQNFQPYLNAGQNALSQMGNLNGLNGQDAANTAMSTFQASPGYQYQLSQGLNAVDHGAAAVGMGRSGATLRAEQTLGANLANQDFSNYYNRLNGLATLGQSSAAGVGSLNGQQTSGIASTDTSAGSADASIYGSTAKALGGAANTGLANPGVQNALSGLFTGGSGSASGLDASGNATSSGGQTLQNLGLYTPINSFG